MTTPAPLCLRLKTHQPWRHSGRAVGGGAAAAGAAAVACLPLRLRFDESAARRGVITVVGEPRFSPALEGPVSGAIALPGSACFRSVRTVVVGVGAARCADAPFFMLFGQRRYAPTAAAVARINSKAVHTWTEGRHVHALPFNRSMRARSTNRLRWHLDQSCGTAPHHVIGRQPLSAQAEGSADGQRYIAAASQCCCRSTAACAASAACNLGSIRPQRLTSKDAGHY